MARITPHAKRQGKTPVTVKQSVAAAVQETILTHAVSPLPTVPLERTEVPRKIAGNTRRRRVLDNGHENLAAADQQMPTAAQEAR
jgi:hypothetical protein